MLSIIDQILIECSLLSLNTLLVNEGRCGGASPGHELDWASAFDEVTAVTKRAEKKGAAAFAVMVVVKPRFNVA